MLDVQSARIAVLAMNIEIFCIGETCVEKAARLYVRCVALTSQDDLAEVYVPLCETHALMLIGPEAFKATDSAE